MTEPINILVTRTISRYRVAAYECTVDGSVPAKKGRKKVVGWYGSFDEYRLKELIAPKLAEYAIQEWSFPLLVVSYMLENNTTARIQGQRAQDVKHKPRARQTPEQNEEVVYSATEYELLR